jgi:hypothetical protein
VFLSIPGIAVYPLCRRGMSETEIFRELPAKNGLGTPKTAKCDEIMRMRRRKLAEWRP